MALQNPKLPLAEISKMFKRLVDYDMDTTLKIANTFNELAKSTLNKEIEDTLLANFTSRIIDDGNEKMAKWWITQASWLYIFSGYFLLVIEWYGLFLRELIWSCYKLVFVVIYVILTYNILIYIYILCTCTIWLVNLSLIICNVLSSKNYSWYSLISTLDVKNCNPGDRAQ